MLLRTELMEVEVTTPRELLEERVLRVARVHTVVEVEDVSFFSFLRIK